LVTRVLVDTSALMAFLDADDPRHHAVVATFQELEHDELLTHGYVVAESLAVVRRRLGLDATITLLDDILPAVQVVAVDAAVHARAQTQYRASLPSGVSFVDQVTIAIIEREAITTAFALDADLGVAGLRLLPSSP
jgi:predicted nucleic acid-binding protein